MSLAKISCVLLVVLGNVDIRRVSGATTTSTTDVAVESDREQDKRYHHQPPPPQNQGYYPPQSSQPDPPLTAPPIPPLIIADQYNRRYSDGGYEYRYALPDETVRYERGYIIPYQNTQILVVKGYYSYLLPDNRYHTVFYTADQLGFREDSSKFSFTREHLPRSVSEGEGSDGDFRDYEAPDTTPITDELE